jgi:hypothetical protein
MMSQEKSFQFNITPKEGAIVFKDEGVDFYYPKEGSVELRETFEFLTFAMIKTEWMAEWYEYLDASEALADLAGPDPKDVPHLTLIVGGKRGKGEDE